MRFGSLWLQVILSSVAVFVVSSVAHMLLKHHKRDYKALPNEDAVADALRKASAAPGVYMIPACPDMAKMKDPAVVKKYMDGPVGLITLMRNGTPNLGRHLVQWFVFCFLVSFSAAYVARKSLAPGELPLTVMRVTGAVAFAGYAYGYFQDSIWKGIPWSNSLRGVADAVAYAIVTGLVFMLMWPAA
jgi:hypothetical protein